MSAYNDLKHPKDKPRELISPVTLDDIFDLIDRAYAHMSNGELDVKYEYLLKARNQIKDLFLDIIGHTSFTKGDTYEKTLIVTTIANFQDELRKKVKGLF